LKSNAKKTQNIEIGEIATGMSEMKQEGI